MVVAVGGRMFLMRPPDSLTFMRIASDIVTCIYYTGIDTLSRCFC